MDWQDYTVWAIGLAVAALLLRRLGCLLRGRRRNGCAACDSTHCPLRRRKEEKKRH